MQQIKAPRGTSDVLGKDSYKWQYVENAGRETAEVFGFKEVRFPTFEETELFDRGVGDTTDIVQKEMYTFNDKGGRSITLRPEGTASVARQTSEHGLFGGLLPIKDYYIISCFRYEKPQAGRFREFHQFGVEMFGPKDPSADVEIIKLAASFLEKLGIKANLTINSIGCPECRAKFQQSLREYFENRKEELCETCKSRLEKNPMRILDCKSPVCSALAKDAPKITDYLCEECQTHFDGVKKRLELSGISYTVNPRIVRGLDYYTKTVFEFVSDNIGAQGTVCGGGRYDGLVAQMGGQPTPALGFAMGLERLILLMDACGCEYKPEPTCDLYIASIGEAASLKAFEMVSKLRTEGLYAENDVIGRSVKAQMKYADKIGAKFSLVLGDDEILNNRAKLKNMATGETVEISLDEDLSQRFLDAQIDDTMTSIMDLLEGGNIHG